MPQETEERLGYLSVVYFSFATNNTHRFAMRLGDEVGKHRIPIRPKEAAEFTVDEPYVLMVPTYGTRGWTEFVPNSVKKFLNNESNRALCRAVIGTGNRNFGLDYAIAGNLVSEKLGVPMIGDFELNGAPQDTEIIKSKLREEWIKLHDKR